MQTPPCLMLYGLSVIIRPYYKTDQTCKLRPLCCRIFLISLFYHLIAFIITCTDNHPEKKRGLYYMFEKNCKSSRGFKIPKLVLKILFLLKNSFKGTSPEYRQSDSNLVWEQHCGINIHSTDF